MEDTTEKGETNMMSYEELEKLADLIICGERIRAAHHVCQFAVQSLNQVLKLEVGKPPETVKHNIKSMLRSIADYLMMETGYSINIEYVPIVIPLVMASSLLEISTEEVQSLARAVTANSFPEGSVN
jgi:hypothetical protein